MMSDLTGTVIHIFSLFTPWLVVGTCSILALYWLVRGRKLLVKLPGPPFESLIAGHFKRLMGTNCVQVQKELIASYGPTIRMHASFREEIIYTIDPAMVHAVFVKDRTKFHRGKGLSLMFNSIFGGGLIGLEGEEHRMHRKMLNPVFNMKFLREMMPTFTDVAKQGCYGIQNSLETESPTAFDIYPWATGLALELVGEAGFGYSFDSFTGKRNEYRSVAKVVTQAISALSPFANLLPYVSNIGTPSLRLWAMKNSPWVTIKQLYNAVGIQNRQAEEVLRERQARLSAGEDLTSRPGRGKDILTLLMKANESTESEDYIDHQALIAHMNVFIMGGHETTSTAVARLLAELSTRQHAQDRLREEVTHFFKENPDATRHEGLLELPYLNAIVRETFRLFSPVSLMFRECEEDAILPLTFPIDTPTGKITSVPVRKGDRIFVSITMADRYEKVWGERADEFLPERWIGTKLEEVTEPGIQIPSVYSPMLTFGIGPRNCIGFAFAVMELKVIIAHLISTFKFEPSDEEFYWQPFVLTFPYLEKERNLPGKKPKLPLKVTKL